MLGQLVQDKRYNFRC